MEMRDQYGVGECLTLGENDLLASGRLRESIDATFGREAHDEFPHDTLKPFASLEQPCL